MTIEIQHLELEQRVQRQIQSGHFHDVDELLSKALDALEKEQPVATLKPGKHLADLLSEPPFAGSELNLERQKSYPRQIDL